MAQKEEAHRNERDAWEAKLAREKENVQASKELAQKLMIEVGKQQQLRHQEQLEAEQRAMASQKWHGR